MTDAEKIAASLSEAQRDWFLNAHITVDGRGLAKVALFALPDGTVRYYSAELDALTPLGLSVRAIIQGETA